MPVVTGAHIGIPESAPNARSLPSRYYGEGLVTDVLDHDLVTQDVLVHDLVTDVLDHDHLHRRDRPGLSSPSSASARAVDRGKPRIGPDSWRERHVRQRFEGRHDGTQDDLIRRSVDSARRHVAAPGPGAVASVA